MRRNLDKDKIRKEITGKKRQFDTNEIAYMSEEVFSVLEITGIFRDASYICIYNSLKDEVNTKPFIDRWMESKNFLLPVIHNDEIVLRHITPNTQYEKSSYGIDEPLGKNFSDFGKIDLVIVPGVAFDRKGNRIGRGKGHYDRFLPKVKAPKAGVCFDFQLLDHVPTDPWDIKMDMIISENDLIW